MGISRTPRLTISFSNRFRGVRRTFTAKTGKLPSFSFYILRGAENREEEKFSGKIFSRRYPIGKRPPPPKEKSVFELFGRFFFGYMGIGEIIYGKIGGDFIWGILYGFCGEWIDIVEGNFWGFFGLEGVLKFQTKNLAGNSRTQ